MIDEEKKEATTCHVANPPAYCSELATPPDGLDYTPFFRCPILLSIILHKRLHILVMIKILSICK
jgi:hypothetical protein